LPRSPSNGEEESNVISVLEEYIKSKEKMILKISRLLPEWQCEGRDGSKTHIAHQDAKIMAATHDLFTVEVIALDTTGHISKREVTTLVPENTLTDHPTHDTVVYLGITLSPTRGNFPQQEIMNTRLHLVCQAAAQFTSSVRTLRQLCGTIISTIDYALGPLSPDPAYTDTFRSHLGSATLKIIGLSHKAHSADRTTLSLTSGTLSLGTGITDILAIQAHKANTAIQRASNSSNIDHRLSLTIPAYEILDNTGRIRKFSGKEAYKNNEVRRRQLFARADIFRKLGGNYHVAHGQPRHKTDSGAQPLPLTTNPQWTNVGGSTLTSLKIKDAINYLPPNLIAYVAVQENVEKEAEIPKLASVELYSAIFTAILDPAITHVYVLNIKDVEHQKLYTETGRTAAQLPSRSELAQKHAALQEIKFRNRLTPSNIIARIPIKEFLHANPIRIERPSTAERSLKTWGRSQVCEKMSAEILQKLHPFIVTAHEYLEQQLPLNETSFWPKYSSRARYLIHIDAGKTTTESSDTRAPDKLKEEYVKRFSIKHNIPLPQDGEIIHETYAEVARQDLEYAEQTTSSSQNPLLVWTWYENGCGYPNPKPSPTEDATTPRWILCVLQAAQLPHRRQEVNLAPTKLTLYLPKQRKAILNPRIHRESFPESTIIGLCTPHSIDTHWYQITSIDHTSTTQYMIRPLTSGRGTREKPEHNAERSQ